MLSSGLLPFLAILGLTDAAAIGKRFTNGDFATGESDPNVTSACTYWANSIKSTDTCAALENYYGITVAQLASWNPSLSTTACTLIEGWSYCVEAPPGAGTALTTTTTSTSTTTTSKTSTSTTSATTTATTSSPGKPSPTQAGLAANCDAFYYVQKDDSCWAISNSYGNFTLDQFYDWNPAVKTDCSGLQPGYYVCVGVAGAGTPATTTTSIAATTTTASSTTSTGSYQPQQTGIASNCASYYFVESGDTCAKIATAKGISLSDFYAWNPAVGSACSTLKAGYWVCVGIKKTPTTTTTTAGAAPSTTASGPSPTQSGLVSDCTTYYQAQSGDSCWSITQKYSYLSTALFEQWNPAVGTSCSNLQVGFYYCVATKNQAPMPNTIGTCSKWHLVASGDSCWAIEQEYSITAAQFGKWNPSVGASCSTLWLGYWVCVGV
ncbi:putative LysM domain protein [Aspergillus homomorphus CBS 101889]|uniref:LysM domain-containing protein n=1 Tax=Aspergillus homomorphus (strain CBS 101889) TaxID=1450537 RepID=A0A395I553_ASPHC|nr:hypothetical protein BO97DRAFT_275234 [Aspergillus homomorphus CBS 101889]RAL14683.1 hypothetical protein BO97DRAFT_275234 [Aspergillus homomorphus CBS 101889]